MLVMSVVEVEMELFARVFLLPRKSQNGAAKPVKL
jgi:hypothetical protein